MHAPPLLLMGAASAGAIPDSPRFPLTNLYVFLRHGAFEVISDVVGNRGVEKHSLLLHNAEDAP